MDLSRGMLRRARRRVNVRGGAALCQAEARRLPFPDETFNVLVNCYMLDLLPEESLGAVLEEFRRVLRPSGRAILVVMGQQQKFFQWAWMWFYHHAPALVGGCRPLPLSRGLTSGWRVEKEEHIVQMGFRSELFLVRPVLLEERVR